MTDARREGAREDESRTKGGMLTRRQLLGLGAGFGACAGLALTARGRAMSGAAGRVEAAVRTDLAGPLTSRVREALASPALAAKELLGRMTLEQKVAQLLVCTPERLAGDDARTEAGEALGAALAELPVGGFIFAGPNIQSREQFCGMLAGAAALGRATGAHVAPLLGVDEEGGPLVARIANSAAFPDVEDVAAMAAIGATLDPLEAARVGSVIGTYLTELGLTVDFAPVADVLTNPDNRVIGSRAFSSDPDVAAEMVTAEVRAMLATGVLPCIKHFPGHGGTTTDSHTSVASTDRSLDELRSCEFLPFAAAIDAGAPMVMTAHVQTPAATGDELPATLSTTMIDGCLRGELGFRGVVVSDSFGMAAIDAVYGQAEAAVLFLAAGGDMVLMSPDPRGVWQGILDAVAGGILSEDRIDQSVRRILTMKAAAGLL